MGTRAWYRKLAWLRTGLLALAACLLVLILPSLAFAQEEKKDTPESNLFTHMIESLGIFFGPMLLLVSIVLVTFIVMLAMDLRLSVAVPPAFVDDFTDMVNKRQFKQAFELCKSDSSYLARVMTSGMGRLQYGIEDARDCAMHMVENVRANKEQLNNFVATIGTLGPLIGLVGTVFGMIQSFKVISDSPPDKQPPPAELAAGISHALVVTLFGIGLSVPAIFCFTLFKNRLTTIQMETANLADDLLTQMYHNSRKAAEAPPTAKPTAGR
jgi:biopolymer transport protein ExbB